MSRLLCTLSFVFVTQLAFSQLWTEDFSGEVDGAITGTAGGTIGGGWNSNNASFAKGSILGDRFYAYQTGAEREWITDPINISGTGRAIIDMNVFGIFVGAGDYIRCYYKLDGLPIEHLFFEQDGGLANFSLTGSAIVTGSSLEIIIRSDVDGGITSFSFDDVSVTAVNTLYSRKTGNWDDVSTGNGTWSVAGLGGASCDCSPLTTDYLIIGNSNIVNINLAATAGGIEIRNTGSLRWTVSGVDLNIDRGILQVDVGGAINRNGQTGVQIDFDRGVITSFINNGTITSEDIEVTVANAIINISGGGSIILSGDFRLLEDNIVVNNDLTGSFTIGDDLIFDQPSSGGIDDFFSDNARFINNQTLTITSDILVGASNDDDNSFTNSVGATLNVANLNFADGDFDFLNSGIVNQSGNFNGIDNADTNVDNLGTGVWNWSLTPNTTFDTDLNTVLNCTAIGNTFNYNGAGAQRIIPVNYHHLNLSTSGAKDANNASFSVAGNWTAGGTASFTEGTGTVIFNGTGVQSVSNPLGETFYNLTLNNTSGSTITFNNAVSVINSLNMTSGIVNLSATTFTLGTISAASILARTGSTTTNWMYNGSFKRFWLSGTAVSSTTGNLYGLFPVGASTASSYRPFQVTSTANPTANGSYTVTHNDLSGVTDLSPAYNDGGTNIVRKHNTQFVNSITGVTGGTYNISATMTGLLIGTLTDIRLAVSNGTTTVTNVGTHVAATGTAPNPTAKRTGVSLAGLTGDFRITTTNSTNTPLPIELISFEAVLNNGIVDLKWETASELNNDHFTIERGASVENFEAIATIKGKGTTTSKSTYSAQDANPLNGESYYRLKQTDFDGRVSFSSIESVILDESSSLKLYPNPSTGIFTLSGVGKIEPSQIRIMGQLGQLIPASISLEGDDVIIDVRSFASGIYTLQVTQGATLRSVRVVKY